MLVNYYLIASGGVAWLCSSLDPIERLARFVNPDVAMRMGKLPPRPGAPWRYMESCEIDCDIENGMVTKVRELIIVRDTAKHQIV